MQPLEINHVQQSVKHEGIELLFFLKHPYDFSSETPARHVKVICVKAVGFLSEFELVKNNVFLLRVFSLANAKYIFKVALH